MALVLCADDSHGAPVKLSYTDDGFQFDIKIKIPTVRAALRVSKLKTLGFFNWLLNRSGCQPRFWRAPGDCSHATLDFHGAACSLCHPCS